MSMTLKKLPSRAGTYARARLLDFRPVTVLPAYEGTARARGGLFPGGEPVYWCLPGPSYLTASDPLTASYPPGLRIEFRPPSDVPAPLAGTAPRRGWRVVYWDEGGGRAGRSETCLRTLREAKAFALERWKERPDGLVGLVGSYARQHPVTAALFAALLDGDHQALNPLLDALDEKELTPLRQGWTGTSWEVPRQRRSVVCGTDLALGLELQRVGWAPAQRPSAATTLPRAPSAPPTRVGAAPLPDAWARTLRTIPEVARDFVTFAEVHRVRLTWATAGRSIPAGSTGGPAT
jgi:hypothetical protein